jgi:hypothetical protein
MTVQPCCKPVCYDFSAGWSSLVARWAHNPKVGGSNPPPATNAIIELRGSQIFDCGLKWSNKVCSSKAEAVQVTAFYYLPRSCSSTRCTTDVLALRFASMKAPP